MKFTENNKLGNGRPLGSKNKATAEIRERFNLLVENSLDKLQADISKLEPFQRIRVIIELSKFVLPTLKSVDVTNASDNDDTFFKKVVVHIIEPHDEEAEN
jgi:hypothetical protein